MNYIDTETNAWPLTEYQIKQANPQTSFPKPFKSERYKPIVDMPQPSFDAITQRVEQVMPVNKGTHWEQTWSVVALDAATVEANQVNTLKRKAAEARTSRNSLIAASDWTQVADAPVDKAAWAAYRKELRDLPKQAGFPLTITWPVAP